MPSIDRIVHASVALRAVSPEAWEQFTIAVREYAAGATADILRCPPEMLMKAQGMAIAVNDLATTFANAHKIKEKIPHGQDQNRDR